MCSFILPYPPSSRSLSEGLTNPEEKVGAAEGDDRTLIPWRFHTIIWVVALCRITGVCTVTDTDEGEDEERLMRMTAFEKVKQQRTTSTSNIYSSRMQLLLQAPNGDTGSFRFTFSPTAT